MSRWTFLTSVGRGDFDGVQDALGLLLDIAHRLERLFLLDLRGSFEMRLAEILFVRAGVRRLLFRRSLRRQAGGDVFRALDFAACARFSKTRSGAALFAHHVGAGLHGFAVGFLRAVAEAALGAETHAAAAPRKIIVTHNQYPFR